jgi:uncharacterized protein YggE
MITMQRALILAGMLLGAVLGRAALAEDPNALVPSITVVGEGDVQVAPDQVTVSLGVTTEAKTAAEALQANSSRMAELLKTLKANNIADKHVQTSNFHISPQQVFDRDGQRPPKVVGYTVTNQVTVKILEIAKLGAILDAVVQAGSNQVQGVTFSVADPQPHLDQARRKAVADAKHRASEYAAAAEVKLGKPRMIQETVASPPRPMFAQAMRGVAAADAPIAAGEQTISAQVTVVYAIEP